MSKKRTRYKTLARFGEFQIIVGWVIILATLISSIPSYSYFDARFPVLETYYSLESGGPALTRPAQDAPALNVRAIGASLALAIGGTLLGLRLIVNGELTQMQVDVAEETLLFLHNYRQ